MNLFLCFRFFCVVIIPGILIMFASAYVFFLLNSDIAKFVLFVVVWTFNLFPHHAMFLVHVGNGRVAIVVTYLTIRSFLPTGICAGWVMVMFSAMCLLKSMRTVLNTLFFIPPHRHRNRLVSLIPGTNLREQLVPRVQRHVCIVLNHGGGVWILVQTAR